MRNYSPTEFVSSCCELPPSRPAMEGRASPSVVPSRAFLHEEGAADEDWFVRGRGEGSLETRCRRLRRLKAFDWASTALTDGDIKLLGLHEYPGDFVGLGCRTNRTLRFFAMDSVDGRMFVENLGLDFRLSENEVALVLYDFKNEIIHVMKEDYLHHNILGFLKNFTFDSLTTFRRTTSKPSDTPCNADHNEICVVEVTSKTFRKIVLDKNKDVLLLYYAPWCGFCTAFNHVFLTLAHHFRSIENLVFARINGDANDIPWQYTVSEYPTLILYPAQSKANSVLYPPHQQKTLPNLMAFILRWSSNSLLLDSELDVCSRDCVTTNMNMTAVRIDALSREVVTTSSELSTALLRLERLERELKDSAEAGAEAADEQSDGTKSLLGRIRDAKSREKSLRRRLRMAELQQNGARYLYGILRSSSESYLDRDALLSIVRQNMIFKSRLKSFEAL